jgi:diadenosine tetraphosphate (Ap4A) HIT family hydrolase
MMSDEQATQVKQQILSEINSNFPEEKKQEAIDKISTLDNKGLEDFLQQNQLLKEGQPQQCIFCSIIEGKIPSYKIQENEENSAFLEINPVSVAHVIIIPKKHITSEKDFPKSIHTLAEEISKRIKSKFEPKDILIKSSNMFGHEILNIIPIYDNENLESERKPADKSELEKQMKILFKEEKKEKPIIKKPKPKKIEKEKEIWLAKRFP